MSHTYVSELTKLVNYVDVPVVRGTCKYVGREFVDAVNGVIVDLLKEEHGFGLPYIPVPDTLVKTTAYKVVLV